MVIDDNVHVGPGIDAASLERLVTAILEASGTDAKSGRLVAATLVRADLRGISTHGTHYVPFYSGQLRTGGSNPRPAIRVLSEHASGGVFDGDAGLGHVVAHRAMAMAMHKAGEVGLGLVLVRNSNHFGAAGMYALAAAEAGFASLSVSNGGPCLVAPGGNGMSVVGNSPTAYGFPDPDGNGPVIFDISMGKVSGTSLISAAARGEPAPEGVLVDERGAPTTDAGGFPETASLLPFGGHKGFGLAVFAEIFAGVLAGAEFASSMPNWVSSPERAGHAMLAIDIERFMPVEEFRANLARLRRDVHEGGGRLPGEGAHACEVANRAGGVPLSVDDRSNLRTLADELGLPAELTDCLGPS